MCILHPACPRCMLSADVRVLVVDDVDTNRMVLKRVLTHMGKFQNLRWQVDEARCGEEALEVVATAESR